MNFWDSSAVVALLVSQPGSEDAVDLFASDPLVLVWWGTTVECGSAISRLRREGLLSEADSTLVNAELERLAAGWSEVEPAGAVRAGARELVQRYPLKAVDALQLSAAKIALGEVSGAAGFVCLDRQLAAAARAEGLRVFPESALS